MSTKEKLASLLDAIEREDYALAAEIVQEIRSLPNSGNFDWKRMGFRLFQQLLKKKFNKTKLVQVFPLYVKLNEYMCQIDPLDLEIRNVLLFYNGNFFKMFMTEKLYDMGVDLLERTQDLIPFLYDNTQFDSNTLNYVKFLAGQTYNFTVANMQSNDPGTTRCIDTFLNVIKLYMKQLNQTLFTILATIHPMDQLLIKSQQFYSFFAEIITFALNSLTADCQAALTQPSVRAKQIYLFKALLLVFSIYRMICASSDKLESTSKKNEEAAIDQLNQIKMAYKTCIRPIKDISSEYRQEIELFSLAIDIYEYSVLYGSLLAKKTKSAAAEIPKNEKKLLAKMTDYLNVLKESDNENLIYEALIYQYLHEFSSNLINTFYPVGSESVKYPAEAMIEFLTQTLEIKEGGIRFLQSLSVKSSQQQVSDATPSKKSQSQIENLNIYIRFLSQRTMTSIFTAIKLGESIVKNYCQQKKDISDSLKDNIERLLLQKLSFIKIFASIKRFSDEDVSKHYSNLEWYAHRISSPLSFNINADYLRFQTITVRVSEERLVHSIKYLKSNQLQPMVKAYRQYLDNLLLGLRMCAEYDKVKEHLCSANRLFAQLGIELSECNWLVMNWCKMKRDMYKAGAASIETEKSNMTLIDELKMSNADHTTRFRYLFEELKSYAVIKSNDNSINFLDESYQVLEKMNSIYIDKKTKKSSSNDLCEVDSILLKSRIQLEMIMFALNNYKSPKYQFKESIEELFERLKENLHSHSCPRRKVKSDLNTSIEMMDQDVVLIDAESTKENKSSKKPSSRSARKRLSSPLTEPVPVAPLTTEPTNKINKRRKLKLDTPQMSRHSSCLLSRMINFMYKLYKFMFDYSRIRDETSRMMKSLTETRIRIKEGNHETSESDDKQIKTNADRLSLQTTQTVCLIVPDWFKDDTRDLQVESNQTRLQELLKLLRLVYEEIMDQDSSLDKHDSLFGDPTMKKQFYDSIDLYAQVCGFMGFLVNKAEALQMKFKILKVDESFMTRGEQQLDSTAAIQYGVTFINLCKALLNLSNCAKVEKLFQQFLFKDEHVTSGKLDSNLSDLIQRIDQNKILGFKEEMRVDFFILLAHFFALTRRCSSSIKIIKEKVISSSIVSGKNTISSFEAKYQYKHVIFLLYMMSVKSSDFEELTKLVDHELPLSILDDVYSLLYPVVRLDLRNAVEPYRVFSHSIQKTNLNSQQDFTEESLFFDVTNAKNFQILTEQLDMLSTMCNYFIEISRYRDATTFIRDALDIAQMNFSTSRCALFLLHQVNADIIGHCFDEASSRLRLAKKFLNYDDESVTSGADLFTLRNILYMHYLDLFREIKLDSVESSSSIIEISNVSIPELINEKLSIVKALLAKESQLADYARHILYDINILAAEYAVKNKKCGIKASDLLRQAREYLPLFSRLASVVSDERWRMARFYLAVNDYDPKKASEYLPNAKGLLEPNPHPTLYRRTLLQMAKLEEDDSQKAAYLLETQSIALRHKAISVHLKHKRKNPVDPALSERFVKALSFGPKDLDGFVNQTLPPDLCVLSLILSPDERDLILVRLERGEKVVVAKFKYDTNYAVVFKHLMQENEKSMKLSDKNLFWSNRNQLNRRLCEFIDDVEEQVFGKSHMKGLLLGGYSDYKLNELLGQIKLKLTKESFQQNEQLLRSLLLCIESYSKAEIKQILSTTFEDTSKSIDSIANYLETEFRPKLTGAKRKHVCLLVDKNLHQIPWESMPITKNQLITRMPSIHFLHTHLITNSFSINKEKGYYIVDPGSDLAHTRSLFQQFFEKRKNWEGIIGVAPNESQFKRALTEYELFIYTGHGSGSQYFPSDEVQRLRVQACSILMGCSSGNQYVLGDFEPYGTVLAYIIAGCPCIVGNLWDVTDRDIDKLTQQFLDSWIEEEESKDDDATTINFSSSICWHLTNARKACRMTYLNGSAPVVYGLPVNFKST